jgi:hypothetical protein
MSSEERKLAKYFIIVYRQIEGDRNWFRYKQRYNMQGPAPPINEYKIKYLGFDAKYNIVTEQHLLSLSKVLRT